MKNSVLIHGGAGSPSSMSIILEGILNKIEYDDDPLNVAVNSVVSMEDDPAFNAGTGSVPRLDGTIQMDAAVMSDGNFGSVICIENVKNPVLVARDVMLNSPHIILSGDGAVKFARLMGYDYYDPHTEKSRNMIRKFYSESFNGNVPAIFNRKKSGDTVGAVARINNKFAAAVSTGGSFPMLRGRVGDSPLIGAGIYSGPNGAVVATGIGEEIAKKLLSYKIYSKIKTDSLENIVKNEVNSFKTSCGIIAITDDEYIAYSNTNMAYAYKEF